MKRSRSGGATTAQLFESFETIPELAALREAVTLGSWPAIVAQLDAFDVEHVVGVLDELATVDGIEDFLEAAVAQDPASPAAWTALARRQVELGWAARGGGPAAAVGSERLHVFHGWLTEAERTLVAVCADHPAYAPAWAVRQYTARGLELGASESHRRWARLRSLGGPQWPAAMELMRTVGPRWLGDAEAQRRFVDDTLRDASEGALVWALVPALHVERWNEADQRLQGSYFGDPAVADELRDAARRSVLHPDFRGGPLAARVHNLFAMTLWLGGHRGDAAAHLAGAGFRLTRYPWTLLADPEKVARQCLGHARAAGGSVA